MEALDEFKSEEDKAKTDKAGKWMITLPEMDAGGPYDMTISSKTEKLEINIILRKFTYIE